MTIKELYNFMVKNKVLEARSGDIHLKLDASALAPKLTKEQEEDWKKQVEKVTKQMDDVDMTTWSV